MQQILKKIDEISGIVSDSPTIVWLERTIFVFLTLAIAAAPHSIAITQIGWIGGMVFWLIRCLIKPRQRFSFSLYDLGMIGLGLWTVITCFTSFDPPTSFDKLRNAGLFIIFYFVFYNLKSKKIIHLAAFLLIGSTMINVIWVPIQRFIGRGVEISNVDKTGPLGRALIYDGDTLLKADGKKLHSPEEFAQAIAQNETTKITSYRPDFEFTVVVKRTDILPANDALGKLGVGSWKKSSNWRSSGFYSHYTTYAEALMLIASLALGIFVVVFMNKADDRSSPGRRKKLLIALFLAICAMAFALLLTVTRASQLSFIISGAVIVFIGATKKWKAIALAAAIPVMIVGVMFLQQSRQVGFFDSNDESIKWRQTVWQEGFDLWTKDARNLTVGVGMDSIKKYAVEWRLFDNGRLPMGHFHSTPLQLLVERGFPALIFWVLTLGAFAYTFLSAYKKAARDDLYSGGILLGALGGLVGFFSSGFVHYNLGDSEVAMIFFIIMALAARIAFFEKFDVIEQNRSAVRSSIENI